MCGKLGREFPVNFLGIKNWTKIKQSFLTWLGASRVGVLVLIAVLHFERAIDVTCRFILLFFYVKISLDFVYWTHALRYDVPQSVH